MKTISLLLLLLGQTFQQDTVQSSSQTIQICHPITNQGVQVNLKKCFTAVATTTFQCALTFRGSPDTGMFCTASDNSTGGPVITFTYPDGGAITQAQTIANCADGGGGC
jgi:hypothetical protein